jgi:predicted ATPase/DNA-binding SARP family transcriptional activator
MRESTATSTRATALRVLGSLELEGPTGPIAIRQGRERKLLSLLLLRRESAVPVDVIIEELWPEQRPANERNALQVLVSGLRRQLEPVSDDFRLERSADAYCLSVRDPELVDAVVFEREVRQAQERLAAGRTEADVRDALALLDHALELWRGTPYTDSLYEPFAQADVARLRELHADAREQRARALLRLGRSRDAVPALQALATEYPLRESVWAALILALYRSQRQGEALRLYTVARRNLVEELGVEPGPELRDLEQRVLQQDPSLDWTPLETTSPDAPTDAIAAPAAAAPSSALRLESAVPAEVSSLVGRAGEIEQVLGLVRANRLVTLTGTGGIGKTRIAVSVASAQHADVTTRVIDLGSLPDGADVGQLVASDLGVQTNPGVDPVDSIASALGDAELLLVLDTCEHVLNGAALVTSRLLRRSPNLRVLATSRQPLGVSGEVVWATPPLALAADEARTVDEVLDSDAVRLFVERARARRHGFELDDVNAADVARICRMLDGLPLAIELAAARVNVLSPSRILERIDDRFALLSQPTAGVDPRQQSLRATIEWSYELLDDAQRTFFDRLSVFASSFDIDAAAFVAGEGLTADPLDLLGALVERSLVQSVDGERFDLLDTLRSFGAERLSASSAAVRDRHAEWYFRVAVAADPWSHGPLPAGWPRLRTDAPNCVAALDWFTTTGHDARAARLAGALAGFWMLGGQILRAHHELGRRREVVADDASLASLWRGLGVLDLYRSRFEESAAAAARSVEHARRTGDPMLVASTLLTFGSALWGTGDLQTSEQSLVEAAGIFDAEADRRGQGFALARLGRTFAASGDERAVDTVIEGTRLVQATGDQWMHCVALEHLAGCLLARGDLAPALVAAERAVDAGRRAGSHTGALFALGTLGRVLLAAGEVRDAAGVVRAALQMSIDMVNPGGIADSLDAGAAVAHAVGDATLAAALVAGADETRSLHGVSVPATARPARERFVAALATAGPAGPVRARRDDAEVGETAPPVPPVPPRQSLSPPEALERLRDLTEP